VTNGQLDESDGLYVWNDLVIDLPEEELAEVERRAQASGLSVEQWARQAIRSYMGITASPRDTA
jgi:hypothetical protein